MIRIRSSKGYTVAELAIALSVTSILIIIIIGFMTSSLTQYTTDTTRANLLNSAQVGFDVATSDIRLSANADQNNRWPDSNAPGGDFSWSSDSDTLVLARAAEDEDGNIIFADPAEYISYKNNVVYFLENGTLYKRTIAGPDAANTAVTTCPAASANASCPADRVILENVIAFEVRYYDEQDQTVSPAEARSIELNARLEKEQFGQPVTVDYTTRMVFRND